MNLSAMRINVRRDLRDEDSENYLWTDDEIDRHIEHALREFSLSFPLDSTAVIATTSDSFQIDISSLSNVVYITAVEYPIGAVPILLHRFSHWVDTVTILCDIVPDGSNCHIHYGKLHTLDSESSTIPSKHEDLVSLGAVGYALIAWASYAINQVNLGGTATPGLFSAQGQAHLRQFRSECKRLGRLARVRTARLYTPATPIVSESSDPGP